MISKTVLLVLGGCVWYLKWTSEGWIFHSLGVSVVSSPWRKFFSFRRDISSREVNLFLNHYSSSSRPVSVYRWRVHSRVVMFQPCTEAKETLYSVYIWLVALLCPRYRCPRYGYLPFHPLLFSSILSLSASASVAAAKSMPVYSHHHIPTHAPLIPLRRLSEVQKQSCSNVLCDHILPPPDVRLHRFQPQILSRCLRKGKLPPSVSLPPQDSPRQFPFYLVLEPP